MPKADAKPPAAAGAKRKAAAKAAKAQREERDGNDAIDK